MTNRFLKRLIAAGLILLSAGTAHARPPEGTKAESEMKEPSKDEVVAELRREIEQLKGKIKSLEERVDALTSSDTAPPSVPELASPGPSQAQAPPPAPPARSPSLLNPAITAVFQTIGSTSLSGADESNGFDLGEAEIGFQAAVDPYAKMDLFLTFPVDESPEVEEGYVSTLSLPWSLMVKGGRYKSAFGKWNTLHTHAFFTVNRPVALVDHLGEESLTNDGLALSWLIPNPWGVYLESISEVGTPREGPAYNSEQRDLMYLEHLKGVFDATPNATIEIGLTASAGRTGPTESLLTALDDPNVPATLEPTDDLESLVGGIDVTWKWKPLARNVYRSFLWQTEWLRTRRDIETLTASFTLDSDVATSDGGYTYIEGQFTKRWRFGGRYDWSELPDDPEARQRGGALVIRFVPSEFQEIRFQAQHIHRNTEAAARFDDDEDDARLLFEWIPMIGAHGAHAY